jgi:hypothetical protein
LRVVVVVVSTLLVVEVLVDIELRLELAGVGHLRNLL